MISKVFPAMETAEFSTEEELPYTSTHWTSMLFEGFSYGAILVPPVIWKATDSRQERYSLSIVFCLFMHLVRWNDLFFDWYFTLRNISALRRLRALWWLDTEWINSTYNVLRCRMIYWETTMSWTVWWDPINVLSLLLADIFLYTHTQIMDHR